MSLIRPLVLVVDDDPAVLDALHGLLGPRVEPAYRLDTATSAEEALDLVATLSSTRGDGRTESPGTALVSPAPVACIITDERMPGASGTDPAHRLASIACPSHGRPDHRYRLRGFAVGEARDQRSRSGPLLPQAME
jgi:CheY-like chemotaxis protein